MRTLILLLALASTSSAMAGTVRKCVDDKGAVTYTQAACPDATTQASARSYQPVADSPGLNWSSQVGDSGGHQGQAPTRTIYAPVQQSQTAAGYQCNDGKQQWVQKTPCPETTRRGETSTISGYTTNGTFVTGTATRRVDAPVEQRALNSSQLCQSMAQGTATARRQSASDAAYERNKMRQSSGCR